MKFRTAFSLVALAAAFAAVPAVAQDQPAGPGAADAPAAAAKDELHTHWDAMQTAKAAMGAASQAKDNAAMAAARKEYSEASEKFMKAFSATDWEKLDLTTEKDLVQTGLANLIGEAMNTKKDGKLAASLCEKYLAKFPDSPAAKSIGGSTIATAWLMAGDVAKATAVWEKASKSDDVNVKCNALLALGDAKAAQGDVAGAQAAWKVILDMPVSGDKDPVKRMQGYAGQRAALVGNAAPEIDSKNWLGDEAMPLSAMKGKVVVVDLWATWCPPCRAAMPGLDEIYKEKKSEGLAMLGVTHFYKNGFVLNDGAKDLLREGKAVNDLAPENYDAHVKAFKATSGISYPFVMATDAEFSAYKVIGIPTMAVVGRDGKVVFVKVGGGDETLLKMAIGNALKAAAPAAEPTR